MDFIEDPKIYRPLAGKAIAKFGHAPEHNVDWFEAYSEPNQRNVYVSWPDGTGLFTHHTEDEWQIFVEPISRIENAGKKIIEFAELVLKKMSVVDIVVEVGEAIKKEVEALLPADLKLTADEYVLTWPVMDINQFDPELPGNHFKSIRNSRSKFFREHKLEVVSVSEVGKSELHGIVDDWTAKRTGRDEAWPATYHKLIDVGFPGMNSTRVLVVDSQPVGFNAGWEVPNSDAYYYAVGIHNYSIRDLGIILYLENLEWIKKAGYPRAEMGGVEEGSSLFFKNRFLPAFWHKTHSFSIVRK